MWICEIEYVRKLDVWRGGRRSRIVLRGMKRMAIIACEIEYDWESAAQVFDLQDRYTN